MFLPSGRFLPARVWIRFMLTSSRSCPRYRRRPGVRKAYRSRHCLRGWAEDQPLLYANHRTAGWTPAASDAKVQLFGLARRRATREPLQQRSLVRGSEPYHQAWSIRSGRWRALSSSRWSRRQRSTCARCPDSSVGGTARPLPHLGARVVKGNPSSPSSSGLGCRARGCLRRAEPRLQPRNRVERAIAAISPPESTKSPGSAASTRRR